MQGAFLRKAPLQRACLDGFFTKSSLDYQDPILQRALYWGIFAEGSLLRLERHFTKGGSSSVQKRLSQSICRLPVLNVDSRTWYKL